MSWRNSRLSIWRPLASSIAMAVGAILISLPPGLATAAPPEREPNPLPTEPFLFQDTLGNNPCDFPVLVEITTNKETVTTFTRQSGATSIHTTGALKVRLTNTETGKTIDRNISGPILATVNSDGSTTQKGTGPALWVFDPGVAPDLPRLVIIWGKTESVLGPETGAFRFISQQGRYEDICATLAP
jgi:ribosomal protein S28E/S33